MIIFYNKKTGKILGTIEGFGHDKAALNMSINDGTLVKDIGKKLIVPESQSAKLARELENPHIKTTIRDYEIQDNNFIKRIISI